MSGGSVGRDPWFKFYPADWNNDIKLQSCSLAAQGLLVKLMCIMHQSEKPGYLLINGVTPPSSTVLPLVSIHHNTYRKLLGELLNNGVLKTNGDGTIICPRMVKDQELKEMYRAHGKRGGNPAITPPPLKGDVKGTVNIYSQKSEVRKNKEDRGTIVPLSGCPFEEVISLYHRILPTMPKIRVTGKKLKARLSARWKEYPDLKWWEEYFMFVAESKFLTGKKSDWVASLHWITGPENLEKILNNHYHRDQGGMSRYTVQNLEALRNWMDKK